MAQRESVATAMRHGLAMAGAHYNAATSRDRTLLGVDVAQRMMTGAVAGMSSASSSWSGASAPSSVFSNARSANNSSARAPTAITATATATAAYDSDGTTESASSDDEDDEAEGDDDGELYAVDRLLAMRTRNKTVQYLTRWTGGGDDEWVDESGVSAGCVREFFQASLASKCARAAPVSKRQKHQGAAGGQ